MNNLILKAIEAIKEDKKDYAVGLLEGVLEMGENRNDKPVYKTGTPVFIPQMTNIPNPIEKDDEGAILDATASARLATIMKLSAESMNNND